MTLKDSKDFPIPIVKPKLLENKVTVLTNCDITEEEVNHFNLALKCVAERLRYDNIDLSTYYTLNVFFTYDGTVSFFEKKEGNCGSQFHIALYRMEPLRRYNSKILMLFIFLEEMVHYFWRIFDETDVKYKIEEIIKDIIPEFTLEDMKEFKLFGL